MIFFLLFLQIVLPDLQEVEAYHKHIIQADRYLYNCNADSARVLYLRAFEYKALPYANDIIKCLVASEPQDDHSMHLVSLLLGEKAMQKTHVMAVLPKKYHHLVIEVAAETPQTSRIDTSLRAKMLDIIAADQAIRDYAYFDSLGRTRKQIYASRDSLDSVHAKLFLEVVEQYGFPSEERIEPFLYIEGDINSYQQLMFILGIHFLQTEYREDLIRLYRTAFRSGLLHPELYAHFYDFKIENIRGVNRDTARFLAYTYSKAGAKTYKPFIHYNDQLEYSIDTLRASYFLHPLAEARRYAYHDLEQNPRGGALQILYDARTEEKSEGFVKAVFEIENVDLESYRLYFKPWSGCGYYDE